MSLYYLVTLFIIALPLGATSHSMPAMPGDESRYAIYGCTAVVA